MNDGSPKPAATILDALGEAGVTALEKLGERHHVAAGTVLFEPGDDLQRMEIVVTGAVEVAIILDGAIEHLVGTIRDGGILGALQQSEAGGAAGRARAIESSELLAVPCGALEKVLEELPHLALPVLGAMVRQMRAQGKLAIADLLNTVRWNAEITGISQLTFGDLITSAQGVTLQLSDGRALAGRILRIDPDSHGGYLVLKCTSGKLHVVRSEAIVSIECGRPECPSVEE
jgi:CRP-like cAMP-binding protein